MTAGEVRQHLATLDDNADVTTLDDATRIAIGEALDIPQAAANLRAKP